MNIRESRKVLISAPKYFDAFNREQLEAALIVLKNDEPEARHRIVDLEIRIEEYDAATI